MGEASTRRAARSEERDALRVELLLTLGDAEPARRGAEAFFQRYPDSAYGERLRSLLKVGTDP